MSNIVQGKYTARTLFTFFNMGFARTYLYELYDESTNTADKESNFGLIANDGTPKPAYSAVKNLIGLLNDPGVSFVTGSLNWSVSGNLANFQHTLFQKRDGSYYLVMWIGAASSDSTISQSATLTVPASITSAHLYSLDNDGNISSVAKTITNSTVSFNLTDSIQVMKLN